MKENYDDIKSRIDEDPTWYDQDGTPRYGDFKPHRSPNIYTDLVALMRIACQACNEEFNVEMHAGLFDTRKERLPSRWHYGDPPVHDCVGDTMNCDDLGVLEVWQKRGDAIVWFRLEDFEGLIDPDEE